MTINHYLKSLCKLFYRTSVGRKVWVRLLETLRRPFVKKVFLTAFYQSGISEETFAKEKQIFNDDLQLISLKKHALVIIPWWGQDATCTNIASLCVSLKRLGYVVHVIHYNDYRFGGDANCFDKVYSVFPSEKNCRHWNIHTSQEILSQNLIDDWVDNNLKNAVFLLNRVFNFKLCICNYAYLSEALTSLPATTLKVLYTHDIFAYRNEKLRDNGINSKYYDFSCTAEEEMKAFVRADYVVAVQKKDEEYLRSLGLSNVVTIPYVPNNQPLPSSEYSGVLKIGFLASSHQPNVVAIRKFISVLEKTNTQKYNYELHIAGSICDSIKDIPSFVKVRGRFEKVDDFYSSVDVLINPDCVASGIKIKCIEALSYGMPLVCTRFAMIGIDTNCDFHQCESIEDCVNKTLLLVDNPQLLDTLREASKNVYSNFKNKYDPVFQLSTIIENFKLKQGTPYPRKKVTLSIVFPLNKKTFDSYKLLKKIIQSGELQCYLLPKILGREGMSLFKQEKHFCCESVFYDPVIYESYGQMYCSAIEECKTDRIVFFSGYEIFLDNSFLTRMLDEKEDIVFCSTAHCNANDIPRRQKMNSMDLTKAVNYVSTEQFNKLRDIDIIGNCVFMSAKLKTIDKNILQDCEVYKETIDCIVSQMLLKRPSISFVEESLYGVLYDELYKDLIESARKKDKKKYSNTIDR